MQFVLVLVTAGMLVSFVSCKSNLKWNEETVAMTFTDDFKPKNVVIVASNLRSTDHDNREEKKFRINENGLAQVSLPREQVDSLSVWVENEADRIWLIGVFEDFLPAEIENWFRKLGEDTHGILELESEEWTLSGQVVDVSGVPMAGARVELLFGSLMNYSSANLHVYAEPDGRFVFRNMNHGEYWVAIYKSGFAPSKYCPHQFPESENDANESAFALYSSKDVSYDFTKIISDAPLRLTWSWKNPKATSFSSWSMKISSDNLQGIIQVPRTEKVFVTLSKNGEEIGEIVLTPSDTSVDFESSAP